MARARRPNRPRSCPTPPNNAPATGRPHTSRGGLRGAGRASGRRHGLARLMPHSAERVTGDGQTEHVPVRSLRTGDLVLVRPGASVPAAGEVVGGATGVGEARST